MLLRVVTMWVPLPKDILGASSQRHAGCLFPKIYWVNVVVEGGSGSKWWQRDGMEVGDDEVVMSSGVGMDRCGVWCGGGGGGCGGDDEGEMVVRMMMVSWGGWWFLKMKARGDRGSGRSSGGSFGTRPKNSLWKVFSGRLAGAAVAAGF
ncbi:hypothetical protein Tco_0265835 [Tanacetum coccineum]